MWLKLLILVLSGLVFISTGREIKSIQMFSDSFLLPYLTEKSGTFLLKNKQTLFLSQFWV